MNTPTQAEEVRVIAALVEGNSIRATVRMTGVSKNAIQRLMAKLGPACEQYQAARTAQPVAPTTGHK
jgi:transposase